MLCFIRIRCYQSYVFWTRFQGGILTYHTKLLESASTDKKLCSLYAWLGNSWLSNLGGYCTYISSLRYPFKNWLLTSIWYYLELYVECKSNKHMYSLHSFHKVKHLIVICAFSRLYPCTANLTLFLVMICWSSRLFPKTYLVPLTVLSWGFGYKCHSSFLSSWCNSSCIETI